MRSTPPCLLVAWWRASAACSQEASHHEHSSLTTAGRSGLLLLLLLLWSMSEVQRLSQLPLKSLGVGGIGNKLLHSHSTLHVNPTDSNKQQHDKMLCQATSHFPIAAPVDRFHHAPLLFYCLALPAVSAGVCGCVCVCGGCVSQLTDVDPPYSKAPTAQLADKLPEKGRAGEVFDTTREMLLETQVCLGGGGGFG